MSKTKKSKRKHNLEDVDLDKLLLHINRVSGVVNRAIRSLERRADEKDGWGDLIEEVIALKQARKMLKRCANETDGNRGLQLRS